MNLLTGLPTILIVKLGRTTLIIKKNFNWRHFVQIGGKCFSGIWKCFFLIGDIFFQIGGNEGKCVRGIWKYFFNWGHFFLSWGQKIILGSRKSIILTTALMFLAWFKISKIRWVSFCWKKIQTMLGFQASSKLVYISAFFRFGLGC